MTSSTSRLRTETPPLGALQVCVGCKDRDPVKRKRGEGGGPELAGMLRDLAAEIAPDGGLVLTEHPCLGRCAQKGRMSLAGPGRWSWLLEAIDPAADRGAIVALIMAWLATSDGFVAKEHRPARLRRKMLGRVPPPGKSTT